MKNTMVLDIGYNSLAFVNLTSAEIGQLSQLLIKSETVTRRYRDDKTIFERGDSFVQVTMVDNSLIVDRVVESDNGGNE